MKLKGPYLTLLVGLVLAAALTVLSTAAASQDANTRTAAQNVRDAGGNADAGTSGGTPAAASPTAAAAGPFPTPTGPQGTGQLGVPPATYAGLVEGKAATLAIAVRDGKVIAYLCDGRRIEAWLQGTATGNALHLTGAKGGTLTGSYGGGKLAGTVTAAGRSWAFSLPVVKAPSGLYRASANVRNARVVGGWIRVNNTVVGAFTTNGADPQPAPELDFTTGTATIDGTQVTAVPIDGETGSGF